MKKLLIVDDHRLFADGIRFLIDYSMNCKVVDVLNTGGEVMPFLAKNKIDILLLDIGLPDMSGFDLVPLIRQTYSDINVLAISMLSDKKSIDRMLVAGAAGYCLKSAGQDELFLAIKNVSEGCCYLPSSYFSQVNRQKDTIEHNNLTERETEVIQLIVEGVSTRKIANKLFLSARTVETHRKNIYRKLGVHTNVELTVYARSHHLI